MRWGRDKKHFHDEQALARELWRPVGREPITPKAQRPSITGCKTAPSASTCSVSGVGRKFRLKGRDGAGELVEREHHIHHDAQLGLELFTKSVRSLWIPCGFSHGVLRE